MDLFNVYPCLSCDSKLGVDVCEAGFPIASEGDFDAVKAIAEEVRCLNLAETYSHLS